MEFLNIESLLSYTSNIIGKTFGELDKLGLLTHNSQDKGRLGKVVETGFYNYPLNNNADADFSSLGVELKVTGFVTNSRGKRAKERLSLSKINYETIIHENYEFSKLISKNKLLLIIWYEYIAGKTYANFEIKHFGLYDMAQDEEVFKRDFSIIKEKVVQGNAHLLSEGDTSFLGACTKAKDSSVRTSQPNSSIDAKPRAFSLKQSYMNGVFSFMLNNPVIIPTDYHSPEDYMRAQLTPFFGMSQFDILSQISDKTYSVAPKNIGKMISDRLIGKDNELSTKHSLFSKVDYIIKNLPISHTYYPLERLSFRNLIISEFDTEWDDSDWKLYFEQVTLLVICYEGLDVNGVASKNGYRILKDIRRISFNDDDLQQFKLAYNSVRQAIQQRDISLLPYPNTFSNQIIEIAPKGNAGDDAYNNFFANDTTKTCFMLSKDFIAHKLASSISTSVYYQGNSLDSKVSEHIQTF